MGACEIADVFISYKQTERPAAELIASRLRDLGFSVWFDASLNAGDSFSDEIDREARVAKVVLVCWSEAARQSRWVKAEAMIGFEADKLAACYVAGLEEFAPPTPFNTVHSEDIRAWLASPTDTHHSWKSVLGRIAKLCSRNDVQAWCNLTERSSTKELRSWLDAHISSPLFVSVESLLRQREELDAQRAIAEQQVRERYAQEQLRLRTEEEERQRSLADAKRQADEAAEAERLLDEQRRYVIIQEKAANARKLRFIIASVGSVLLLLAAVLAVGVYLRGLPSAEELQIAANESSLRQVEHEAFTEPLLANSVNEMRIANGETLEQLVVRSGASTEDARAAVESLSGVFEGNRLPVGWLVLVFLNQERRLAAIVFKSEPGVQITTSRTVTGEFLAREVLLPLTFENAHIAGTVETSLYESALELGATDREIAAIASVFPENSTFLRDISTFEVVFERYFDDEGNTVRTGDLLFLSLRSRTASLELYAYLPPGDARPQWYRRDGSTFDSTARRLTGRALSLFQNERVRIDALRQE